MKTHCVAYYIIFLICSIFGATAQDKEQKLFFSGYVKNLNEFSFIDRLEQLKWTTLLHNRLIFKEVPSNEITIRMEFRNRLYYGDATKNIQNFSKIISQDTGLLNLNWNIIDNETLLFNMTIDRASVNFNKNKCDITLGRQRVNWGMNLVWNPNDIFNTYNFLDFDYEERPGSDAIRIQYYLGDFSKLEVSAKKGKSKSDFILAGMYKFNVWSYDVQLITGVYQKDWMVGTGWAGNLKEAGFKGEISYFVPYESYLNSENTLSASLSFDYAFKQGLYINCSGLYTSHLDETLHAVGQRVYTNLTPKKLMPFKYSAFLQLAKEYSPILNMSLSSIYSPTKHSIIIMPNINYSMAQDWELNLTSQSFFEFEAYKALANAIYLRLRWSF